MSYLKATTYYLLFASYLYVVHILFEVTCYVHFFLSLIGLAQYSTIGRYPIFYRCIFGVHFSILQILGIRFYYAGDYVKQDRAIYISNHRSKLDALTVYGFLVMMGVDLSAIVKKDVKYIPLLNTFFVRSKYILIKRRLDQDLDILSKGAKALKESHRSVMIFPEGTTMSPPAMIRSVTFAHQNQLPKTKHVLLPRLRAFEILKEQSDFNLVGNMIVRYENPSIPGHQQHNMTSIFRLFPSEIYVCLKYENFLPNQLYDKFREKDEALSQPINKEKYRLLEIPYPIIFVVGLLVLLAYYLLFAVPYLGVISLLINLSSIRHLYNN